MPIYALWLTVLTALKKLPEGKASESERDMGKQSD